ncbi:MAG: hypothetical protein IJ952_02130, partial [Alistipes sp.]|nr:hypothetical protein [Alistipes sp.]
MRKKSFFCKIFILHPLFIPLFSRKNGTETQNLIISRAPKNKFCNKDTLPPLRALPLALEGEFFVVVHCKVFNKRLIP